MMMLQRPLPAAASETAPANALRYAGVCRVAVYVACTVAALLTTLRLGKDLPWDAINYHLYAGLSAVHDRFAQDYFAAGPESYDNPYAYVPFYALVSAGLTSLQISLLLATVQSAILWLTYELALIACPQANWRTRVAVGACAAALAYANPILMQQFGTSFSDVTTAELVMAGWLLLAAAFRTPSAWRVLAAGLLVGAATALKPTNAVDAVASVAVAALLPVALPRLIGLLIAYGGGVAIGFAAVSAPWSYQLAKRFGNPFFPLLNNLFRSPEFTTQRLLHYRFIPDSLAAALWRPFTIAKPLFMIQEELRAPDIRYAVLVLLGAALLGHWLWRRVRRHPRALPDTGAIAGGRRLLGALGLGVALAWVGWVTASGNGRYFIPMACVAAVVIVGLAFALFRRWPKARNYFLLAVFAVQGVQLAMGASYRWNAVPWTPGPWLKVVVPKPLATEPNLYLTLGFQSNAFVAAYLAKGSGLINVAGSYPLSAEGATGARVRAMIHRFAPHVRMLLSSDRLGPDRSLHEPVLSNVNTELQPFGLRVEAGSCAQIVVQGLPPDLKYATTSQPDANAWSLTTYLVTCRLVPGVAGDPARLAMKRDADTVLDRLEDACPALFQPRRPVSQPFGAGWGRYYLNTDLSAWVSKGWLKFDDLTYSRGLTYIGRESDWLKGPLPVVCGRSHGHYFVKQRKGASSPETSDHDIDP